MPRASELNPATIAAYRQAFGIDAIAAIATTGLTFVGAWAANGAAPIPTANGQYWIVSVAGTTNLGGINSWEVGDWAIYKGVGVWVKAPNPAEGVAQGLVNDLASTAAGKGGEMVSFKQSGTGAVVRTMQDKAREVYSAKDVGAVGDGVADDTVALKKAFDHCLPAKKKLELEGTYKVSGQITTSGATSLGECHIVCKGDVRIIVDAGATAFRDLLYLETTAANNCSISGGSLTIDLANKCASGITFRHNAAGRSGSVNIQSKVSVLNAKANDPSATYENQGILVFGNYESVCMTQPTVKNVSRVNVAGVCKGISISGFSGDVLLLNPHVENVLCPSGGTDADGIAVFAKDGASTYNYREGTVTIVSPVLIDCQGRSVKSQCSDTTILNPRVKRQMVVSISQGTDFDFQSGNGKVIEPHYEYRLNGATSPLGASHTCVSFQQTLDNLPMVGKSIGGELLTEVLVPRYASVIHQATALASETEVSGLRVKPLGALVTNTIDRAIIETSAATIVAKSAKTRLIVRDVSGPLNTWGIGYTGYTTGDLTTKLSWEVTGLNNSLPITGANLPFKALSGSSIAAVERFLMRDNHGYLDLITMTAFDVRNLIPGCKFTATLGSTTITNGPPAIGASGYAIFECTGQYFDDTDKTVSVTVNGIRAWTQNGGTTWKGEFFGSKVHDWPSLATATQQSTTVTVTGAAQGDIAEASINAALSGSRMWAEVTAANTVTVYHRNDTGSPVDVANATLYVRVRKI